jgi:Ca-activated chloride channel homolog
MNIHPDDPKWTAYVLGELNAGERAEVERELESSPEARELVDDIRMMSTVLKDELAAQAEAALLPQQRQAIIAAPRLPFWRRRWILGGLTASAVAATVIFAVVLPRVVDSPKGVPIAATLSPEAERPAGLSARANELPPPPLASGSTGQGNVVPNGVTDEVAPLRKQSQSSAANEADAFRSADKDQRALLENKDQAVTLKDLEIRQEKAKETQSTVAAPASEPVMQDRRMGQQGQQSQQALQAQAGAPSQFGSRQALAGEGALGRLSAGNMIAPAAPPPPPGMPGAPRDRITRPSFNTEAYDRIEDNPFKSVADNPLATFSVDVDTAAYANMRRFLDQNQLPPKDAVRIEELINYFSYDYGQPSGQRPIAVYAEAAAAPWKPEHRLVRIAVKARDIEAGRRPPSNLVFLIDVSGSMEDANKLPLLKSALKLLVDKLGENDRVTIAVYAGNSGLALQPTRGDRKDIISQALDRLRAGGSTNGASGIQLAYNVATANFITGGVNRVILCTDGDFNVGITSQGELARLIEDRARSGVFLSVLGFGMGNLKDSTMEKLADQGNGNYAYIDSLNEARKVLVEEMGGTLMTVAKDVKIQVDFNPQQVNGYRLIGYENRVLRDQDFNDDSKDAGDMGAGQTVTALFEIVPRGVELAAAVEPSKYRAPAAAAEARADRRGTNSEMLTVRLRYKQPDAADSARFDVPLIDRGASFESASADYRFAASVAEFGMILRESPYRGSASFEHVLNTAERSRGADRNGYRDEFVRLVRRARALKDLRW